ncbi:hypothetical protein ACUH7Y_24975 [Clostridium beijerinckii]|uniref:DUF5659 domain-containing protein n=1 Tax=Clostridium beijerinckii TaxID=1520 RepID=A0A7X9XNK3_CLOBE|nr:hypothetical protein [Clostridium beijerinckii]NMF04338.1 hypothetical protein [Clostridium beijerinckii]
MENNKEYYFITNKFLAMTMSYLLQEKYYQFEHKDYADRKVYSFKDTAKFREVLTLVQNIKNENKDTLQS